MGAIRESSPTQALGDRGAPGALLAVHRAHRVPNRRDGLARQRRLRRPGIDGTVGSLNDVYIVEDSVHNTTLENRTARHLNLTAHGQQVLRTPVLKMSTMSNPHQAGSPQSRMHATGGELA